MSACATSDDYDEELRENCGLFGCVASGDWPTNLDVAHIIYLGLIALQHRGQESAGITTSKGEIHSLLSHRGGGLVSQAFKEDDLMKLKGNLGIGHTRYSTLGGTEHLNTQPFVVHTKHGLLSVAHNGELVNASVLRRTILEKGVGLSTGSDSELITQILSMPPPNGEPNGPDWPERIKHLMSLTKTAYSLLIMFGDTIYAIRDPYGNRPLCIGKLIPPRGGTLGSHLKVSRYQENGHHNSVGGDCPDSELDGYVVSSESCAFHSVSGRLIREVEPGEIVEITRFGLRTVGICKRPKNVPPAFCIFEYVYFARADSEIEGQQVYQARVECGKQLARESPVEADLVSSVPESATPAAFGYAAESGIPYVEVLNKNRYVGRTFIQPSTRLRQLAVLKKFGTLTANFKDKRVILVDDSIVRGTTIGAIIRLLKEAGAAEVHIRIASPPLHYPCYMGINIPTKEELIANRSNAEELAQQLGAASLVYLSVDGLVTAVRRQIVTKNEIGHCTACLTGNYPVKLEW